MDNADIDLLIIAMSTVTRAYIVDAHERKLVRAREKSISAYAFSRRLRFLV